MLDRIRNFFAPRPTLYGVRPEAREEDYPAPAEQPPTQRLGGWVYLGYYVPGGLMPAADVERYMKDGLDGESLYQCISEHESLILVRNNAGHEYRVDPRRVIWVPAPQFRLGDSVRTKVGSARTGWISARQWHRKDRRLYYLIDILGSGGRRKRHTRRYWDTELELADTSGPASAG